MDITIVKPIIEACTGEDLITGEDLTDMERGLKVVFAVVDLVTLGGAIAATKFSEMGLKEGLKAFGKTALIDLREIQQPAVWEHWEKPLTGRCL